MPTRGAFAKALESKIAETFEQTAAAQLPEFLNRRIALSKELIVFQIRRGISKSGGGNCAAFESTPQQQKAVPNTAPIDGLLRVV